MNKAVLIFGLIAVAAVGFVVTMFFMFQPETQEVDMELLNESFDEIIIEPKATDSH